MIRTRLALAALAAGLACGCSSDFSLRSPFHHNRAEKTSAAVVVPDCPTCTGDFSGYEAVPGYDSGPVLAPPEGPVAIMPEAVPPVAGPPRLVPTPATPIPYTPHP